MEKMVAFCMAGISFILFPAIALIFCSILKHSPTKIECLYMGIHCLGGLASIMAGLFFMGSGSTGVACLNTGRNFIGIEKDSLFFETASKRIMQAEKIGKEKILGEEQ